MKSNVFCLFTGLGGAHILRIVGGTVRKSMLAITVGMICMRPVFAADTAGDASKKTDVDRNNLIIEWLAMSLMGWDNSPIPERVVLYGKVQELVGALENNTAELQKNYEDMKAKEQSAANKLIGAIGIGTVGAGGQMLASGLAEKKSDESAEQDMVAYLSTFTCRYTAGKVSRGGDVGVALPGGNELTPLVSEYKKLAADLKMRKEALGMLPGIESEEILDKATAGLYDDEAIERVDGQYTSLSKALRDKDSEDAAEWAAQKEETSKNIKTGAGLAIGGAVVSAAASAIANKDAPKERSKEILEKRYDIQKEITSLIQDEIVRCNKQIREYKADADRIRADSQLATEPMNKQIIAIADETDELPLNSSVLALAEHKICN